MTDLPGGTARETGAALAALHGGGSTAAPPVSEYPEREHHEGWALRSALVRYAQPEPVRAAAVLELVRRTDAALAPRARLIERQPRVDDLARARRRWGADFPALLDAYLQTADPLSEDEVATVELLSVAAELDALGAVLARWAPDPSRERPDEEVDRCCRRVLDRLAELGVEREERRR